MVKVILKMVVVLALLCYGALFLSWNMANQEITTWQLMSVKYSQPLPVGSLVFIGLILGAVLMAVACWSAWAAQKALAGKAVSQVKRAKEKLQAQLDLINELRGQVTQLESDLDAAKAGNGTWGLSNAGDVTVPQVAAAPDNAEVADDDPEVI
jgi:uncharacterized membrane protein YciS (DUF1049 family)